MAVCTPPSTVPRPVRPTAVQRRTCYNQQVISRTARGRDPQRSRLSMTAAFVVSAGCVVVVLAAGGYRSAVARAVPGVLIAAMATTLVCVVLRYVRVFGRPWRRPAQLVVIEGGFAVPEVVPSGWTAAVQILVYGVLLSTAAARWRLPGADGPPGSGVSPVLLAAIALMTVTTVLTVALSWSGFRVTLTPVGLLYRTALLRRTIPWEAFEPGSPTRSGNTDVLALPVHRPNLIAQHGWTANIGPRSRPRLPLSNLHVHPWFLTDTIRWYTQHPEDRERIGTHAEHDRLIAALTGRSPQSLHN